MHVNVGNVIAKDESIDVFHPFSLFKGTRKATGVHPDRLGLRLGKTTKFGHMPFGFYKQMAQIVIRLIAPELCMRDIDQIVLINHSTQDLL
jgi:hypothetical protein